MSKAFATACFVAAFATGCSSQQSSPSIPTSFAGTPANGTTTDSSLQSASRSNFAPSSTSGVLFSDTFEQDTVGIAPAGWTTVSGSWQVCQLAGQSHDDCQTNSETGIAVPRVSASAGWANYQVDGDLLHKTAAGGTGLLARMKDSTHFYQFEIRNKVSDPSVQTWDIAVINGRSKLLLGGTFAHPLDEFVHVRLVLNGSSIAAYSGKASNLTLLGKVADTTYATGNIGLRTWGTNGSMFDNVTVSTIASSVPSPSPTAQPSTSPTSAPTNAPGRNVATFDGCPVFTGGDYYNADVTDAKVDPHSSSYIASAQSVDNTGFYASLGLESVNLASNNTPLLKVKPKVSYHSWPVSYPWSAGYKIEDAGDGHYVAINIQSCHLFEGYGMSYSNGTLSGYSGKNYDLRKPFAVGIGVMASGLSMFAGAFRHEEIATGIHHALNFSLWQSALCNCSTPPAAGTDGVAYKGISTSYELPYGAHLRLHASYNCSAWATQSAAICAALKHYGMFASDTGSHYSNNNALYSINPGDGGSWSQSDLNALSALRLSDFDVLTVGSTK